MGSQGSSLNNLPMDRLAQLEAENKVLREEVMRLGSSHQSVTDKFENRLAIEEAYTESQHRFRTVFEQSKLGNKIITSDLQIVQVNQSLQMMLGYSEKELVGTKVLDYAHPDFVDSWRELQKNLWKKRIPSFGIETCLVRKNGSSFGCNVTSILFKDGEHTLGYTIVEDISVRKAIEEKLKKLYDSQEMVTHMVAHDLKNPIHNIKTLSSFLKKEVEALQDADAQNKSQSLTYIEMIADSCEKAYTIIRDLLFIGEIELGKQTLKRETTEMKSFIETQLSSFQLDANEKGIEINYEYPPEEAYAQINRDKFARVIENLLSNAISTLR